MLIMNKKGFNIIEILVACIIVGILAAVALIQMRAPKDDALRHEAINNLKLLAGAEMGYKLEVGDYVAVADEAAIYSKLRLRLSGSATRGWKFYVTKPANNRFHAVAEQMSVSSPKIYYINESMEEPVLQP